MATMAPRIKPRRKTRARRWYRTVFRPTKRQWFRVYSGVHGKQGTFDVSKWCTQGDVVVIYSRRDNRLVKAA